MGNYTLLLTGGSGFLGSNIKPLLSANYRIRTIGLTDADDIKLNLAEEIPFLNERFDIVVHAAGKAHVVPKNKSEVKDFFDVNCQGTRNLCAALEKSGFPKSFIFVSSVAVYGAECGEEITEDHPLNGSTPYALSKIQAEQFLTDWCRDHDIILSILRPSLLAGPNPPGNLEDMIHGIKKGFYLRIGDGMARKSVLMVQDIANLIPIVAEKGGIYNVCDSDQPTFKDLEGLIASQLGRPYPISVPYKLARMLSRFGDRLGKFSPINTEKLNKITKSLTYSNAKARKDLSWKPLSVLENFRIK